MQCVVCEGVESEGCTACHGEGITPLLACPKSLLTPDIFAFFEAIDFAEEGVMPVVGGLLDQSAMFIEALRFARAQERKLADEKRERDRLFRNRE